MNLWFVTSVGKNIGVCFFVEVEKCFTLSIFCFSIFLDNISMGIITHKPLKNDILCIINFLGNIIEQSFVFVVCEKTYSVTAVMLVYQFLFQSFQGF